MMRKLLLQAVAAAAVLICSVLGAVQPANADPLPYEFTALKSSPFELRQFSTFFPTINNAGVVAYTEGRGSQAFIFLVIDDGTSQTEIHLNPVFGFNFTVPARAFINDQGAVAVRAASFGFGSLLRFNPDGSVTRLATINSDGVSADFRDIDSFFSMNNAGQVAAQVILNSGEIAIAIIDDGGFAVVDTVTPNRFSFSRGVAINDARVVAYGATEAVPSVFTGDGISPAQIALPPPSGCGIGTVDINNNGLIAGSGSNCLVVGSGGVISGVIVDPATTPFFRGPGALSLNNLDQVVFQAATDGRPVSSGLYFGDDPINDKLIQVGDMLFGEIVGNKAFSISGPAVLFGGDGGFNDQGQVVFLAGTVSDTDMPTSYVIRADLQGPPDTDNDGVPDANDLCPGTVSGDPVDANGCSAAQQTCVTPPSGLVSWWPGDGNALDIQGRNNGSVIGTVGFTTGKVGQAFNFGGAGHIRVADSPSLNLINEFTLDFWYNRSSSGGFKGLIAKRGAKTNYGVNTIGSSRFGLGLYYNDPTVADPNSDDRNVFETIRLFPTPPTGQFHHFAGTYKQIDPTHVELKMYVDSALVRNEILLGNLANTLSTVDVVIGASAPTGGERFRGLIDEVEIYNRALSLSEIQAIFNAGSAGKCKVEPATFLIIDEDSIDNGSPPNFFFDFDVNDGIAAIGLRAPLPGFAGANVGTEITLYTGEVGDEGWFTLKTIPESWAAADPDPATDTNGLTNYILAGPGLGTPDANGDREALLDKIPDVTPLRATGLKALEGQRVCAVVHDSDVSINYDPLDGSLKGDSLGRVAFSVVSVTPLTGESSSSLPEVRVEILDTDEICEGDLILFEDAPTPVSSSEPFDTGHDT